MLWKTSSQLPTLDAQEGFEHDSAGNYSILYTDISPEYLRELHELPDVFSIRSSFSLTHGSVFSSYAHSYLRTVHGSTKRDADNPNLLKGKLKAKYLEYLKDRGLHNVYTFLNTFVSSLAEREAKKASRKAERKRKRIRECTRRSPER